MSGTYGSNEPVVKGKLLSEWTEQLRDLDDATWCSAVQAIVTAGEAARGTAATATLAAFLEAPHIHRAALAMWALGKIADPCTVPAVIARLERSRPNIHLTGKIYLRPDPDYYVIFRGGADFAQFIEYGFWTLSRCGGPDAIEFLRSFATTEPVIAGVNAANDALSRLGSPVMRRTASGCSVLFGLALIAVLAATLAATT